MLSQFKKTYFEECAERLSEAEAHLLELDGQATNSETLNAIFRAVHSIKGGAGAFGFERLVRFAHVFETVLDALRDGRIAVTARLGDVLIKANDVLSKIVSAAESETALPDGFENEVVRALESALGAAGQVSAGPDKKPGAVAPAAAAAPVRYTIRFAPKPELFRSANEPLLLIRALKALGPITVAMDAARLPALRAMDPELAYLAWVFTVETAAAEAEIRDVFEFVLDDCALEIAADKAAEGATVETAGIAAAGATTTDRAPEPTAGAAGQAKGNAPASVRVDVDKLDRLVNLVGELVITQAMLVQQTSGLAVDQHAGLIQGLEQMAQHTRELQDGVMALRAQPVKSVFARMPRVVREIAGLLGKEIRLVMTGEGTEIDKTVIEQLGDPLTHMIRNAADHGLETPDERVAAGKPRQGTVHLSAEHRGGRIVIEISDDGRGINRQKVLKKAQDRGIVPPGASLSDAEIDDLIFAPGLSTAEQVSNISGRGVGMDVVKRNIQNLGGRVSVESTPGSGSRFILSLPLTLAVLDGMIVAVGAESYIVPLTNIVESLRPQPQDVHSLVGRGQVLAIRGEYAPLLYLNKLFGVPGAVADPTKGLVVMVETEGAGKVGLVVDELIGQQQVVIKSLETNYDPVEGIAAATILGNGRVALILDIAAMRQMADREHAQPRAAARVAAAELH